MDPASVVWFGVVVRGSPLDSPRDSPMFPKQGLWAGLGLVKAMALGRGWWEGLEGLLAEWKGSKR